MNRFEGITKPLMWLMALLLAAFVAGCGGDDGTPASSAKAITAYSLSWTAGTPGTATGTITEATKAIAVTVPSGTIVTAMIATFTTTGASVKVAGVTQVSATTPNNFTASKAYLVTAADGTTATYTVTVTAGAPVVAGTVCTGLVADCVDLGTAANYVILDEATVTFTPIAIITTIPTITGNIGLSPAAASFLIGFPTSPPLDSTLCFSTSTQVTGKLYAADYSTSGGCVTMPDTATLLTTAIGDKNAAYDAALLKPLSGGGLVTACPGGGAMSDALIGAPTNAGVYACGNVTIPGDLTLNGSATDVWVFKITGTLAQTGATNVIMGGNALPQNVFWIVSNGVSIGGSAHMEGVVLSATNINLVTSATVTGRLLARTGVLMDSNTVTQP